MMRPTGMQWACERAWQPEAVVTGCDGTQTLQISTGGPANRDGPTAQAEAGRREEAHQRVRPRAFWQGPFGKLGKVRFSAVGFAFSMFGFCLQSAHQR